GVQTTAMATVNWMKENWLFILLFVVLYVAAASKHGPVNGAWIAGAVFYVMALMWFCSLAIPALFLGTRLSWKDWLLLSFAGAYALLAYCLGFQELIEVGVYGLTTGLFLGLLLLFFS